MEPDWIEIYPRQRRGALRIVSHNTFWFQGVPFFDDQPPAPQPFILERLASMYEALRPDVLCLQEIHDESSLERLSEHLGISHVYRPGGAFPQYGGAVFSRWPMALMPLGAEAELDRVHMYVRLYIDDHVISLANLHLPSNRHRGRDGGPRQRLWEINYALTRAGNRPDIVLGDFNEEPHGSCSSVLRSDDYVDTAVLCGAHSTGSGINPRSRLDQIWLRGDRTPWLHTYFVVPPERMAIEDHEKTHLSDHLPIGIDIVLS
ncbi:MAG: endonuclease/exonuclease/phosphatase family protein [Limnochordia bacterium]|jgi:endonuclease/exonuclease/phosphatase family metal-dependent hydrolase